jgi:hypothetical protein
VLGNASLENRCQSLRSYVTLAEKARRLTARREDIEMALLIAAASPCHRLTARREDIEFMEDSAGAERLADAQISKRSRFS